MFQAKVVDFAKVYTVLRDGTNIFFFIRCTPSWNFQMYVIWQHSRARERERRSTSRTHKTQSSAAQISSSTDVLLLLLLFCIIFVKNVLVKYRFGLI
jgi:hypothetical protein